MSGTGLGWPALVPPYRNRLEEWFSTPEKLYASFDTREELVSLLRACDNTLLESSLQLIADALLEWHADNARTVASGRREARRRLTECLPSVPGTGLSLHEHYNQIALQSPLALLPVLRKRKLATDRVVDRGARATEEIRLRQEYALRLAAIMQEAQLPVCKVLAGVSNAEEAWPRLFGTRRSKTLRNRFRAWDKFREWLLYSRGRSYPEGVADVLDYANERFQEGCGKTVLESLQASLSVIEGVGRVPSTQQISQDPTWQAQLKSYTADLVSAAPPEQPASMLTVAIILACEIFVCTPGEPSYLRALGFVCLLMVWGSLRADDVQGLLPQTMLLDERGLSIDLARSKTTGPDKRTHTVKVFVERSISLTGHDWLKVGYALWKDFDFERDYLVLKANEGFTEPLEKSVPSSTVALYFRKVLSELKTPKREGRTWKANDQRPLLPGYTSSHFTGHSARNFLSSVGAAIDVDPRELDYLGRWKVGGEGSATYIRTSRQVVHRLQSHIACSLVTGQPKHYIEVDSIKALTDYAAKAGESESQVRRRHTLLEGSKGLGGSWPTLALEVGVAAPPSPVEQVSMPGSRGNYFIVTSRTTGLRRLHMLGCYVKPENCYDVKFVNHVGAEDVDNICKDCKARMKAQAGEEESDPSSSDSGRKSHSAQAVRCRRILHPVTGLRATGGHIAVQLKASGRLAIQVLQGHRRFQAIADSRPEARAAGKADFGFDDGAAEGRQQIAGVVAAWELARDVISKETETRAEAKVLGQPRILQVTERQAMLKAVAAVHGQLGESETPSSEYLALKCEECEANEPQASTLDAITSKKNTLTTSIQSSLDASGRIHITQHKSKSELPTTTEAYRKVLRVEAFTWLCMASRFKSKQWLQDLKLSDFDHFVNYILGEKVAQLTVPTSHQPADETYFTTPLALSIIERPRKWHKGKGKGKDGDVGSYLQSLGNVTNLLQFDLQRSTEHDLTKEGLWQHIFQLLGEGDWILIVEQANYFLDQTVTACQLAWQYVLEHPEDLGATPDHELPASIWQLPALRELQAFVEQPPPFASWPRFDSSDRYVGSACKGFPASTEALASFVRSNMPGHPFTTISLYLNTGTKPHKDSRNAPLPNGIIGVTDFVGGEIWVEAQDGESVQIVDGKRLSGHLLPISETPTYIHAYRDLHLTMPWKGKRLVIIAFSVSEHTQACDEDLAFLRGHGFVLPGEEHSADLEAVQSDDSEVLEGGEVERPEPFKHQECHNIGLPLNLEWDGKTQPITDGFGLCSPTRWPPEARGGLLPKQALEFATAMHQVLRDFVADVVPDIKRTAMELALGRLKESPFTPEMLRVLRKEWFSCIEAASGGKCTDLDVVPSGQPFFLHAVSATARLLQDPDWKAVYEYKHKSRKLDESDVEWHRENYSSANETSDQLEKKFAEEEALGRMAPSTLPEVVHLVRSAKQSQEATFCLTGDVTAAHRLFLVREADWPLLCCKVRNDTPVVWYNKVGTFGISSSAFLWSRLFGIIGRCTARFLLTLWFYHLVFVDDVHANFAGREKFHHLLMWLACFEMFGTPFAYKKFRGGLTSAFVGYELSYPDQRVGISESRGQWLLKWIAEARSSKFVVSVRRFAEFLGRLGFVARLLVWLKAHLAPLYSWRAAVNDSSVARMPDTVILTLEYLDLTFRDMTFKVAAARSVKRAGVAFRADAKCADGYVVLGGWDCAGTTQESRWFSLRLTPSEAPYLFDSEGHSQWASASAELLATLAALHIFGHLEAGPTRRLMKVEVLAQTDNKSNEGLTRKGSTTRWPLLMVNMQLTHVLMKAGLRLNLGWRPRDENQEADDLTNEIFDRFSEELRVPVQYSELPLSFLHTLYEARRAQLSSREVDSIRDTVGGRPRFRGKRKREKSPW
ncbi:FCPC [Symbiodinium sp. CCMP2592]|nr:FCPC [Symbiodinium sp. CCMP2592]